MSEFIVSCCSSADLSLDFVKERDIKFIGMHFNMDGKDIVDDFGQAMPLDVFYKKIADGAEPTTSQVNVEDYINYFEDLLKEGKPVIHMTLSSGISGTFNAALIAQQDVLEKNPDAKLTVIDSLAASSGYGLLVTLAADYRDAGKSYEDTVEYIERIKHNVQHWFFSTDLTSYIRGGRVSAAAGWFGTILKICPLLNVNDEGKLIPREKCRGIQKAISTCVDKMVQFVPEGAEYDGLCYISNSNCPKEAEAVQKLIEEKFPKLKGKIKMFNIGAIIGSHTGQGTVALFFVGDKKIH